MNPPFVSFVNYGSLLNNVVETCVAERLTPPTPDLVGGPGFKPRPPRCFLRQGTLLYKWSINGQRLHTDGGYPLRWTSIPSRGEQQYSQVLHASETGMSYCCLGLCLGCSFTYLTFPCLEIESSWILEMASPVPLSLK